MKQIETSINIHAPISKVWKILMKLSDYSMWNPFITEIHGNTSIGNRIEVKINPNNERTMVFKPIVLNKEKEKEFRWLGHLYVKGLFDGEHYFKLRKINSVQTQFIHGEKFSGVLKGIILKMVAADTKLGFEAMNKALKEKAEKKH